MANRRDYYYRQPVTEGELDDGFAQMEAAITNLASDTGMYGIVSGLVATENDPVADLTVDLTGDGTVYDRLGQRIRVDAAQDVDCSVDESSVPTEVQAEGNERWLAVFAGFDRLLTDPRTDGNGQTVYFERNESFEIVVRQGAEAGDGLAQRVGLDDALILICDIKIVEGQTQILDADISTTRRQTFVIYEASQVEIDPGGLVALAALGTVQAALELVDEHLVGTSAHHAADAIDAEESGWLSGATVAAQLAEIVADLGLTTGATRVGAATSGWLTGVTVAAQLAEIVAGLGLATKNTDGASRIGAEASGAYMAGTVRSQIDGIIGTIGFFGTLETQTTFGSPAAPVEIGALGSTVLYTTAGLGAPYQKAPRGVTVWVRAADAAAGTQWTDSRDIAHLTLKYRFVVAALPYEIAIVNAGVTVYDAWGVGYTSLDLEV